MKKRLWAVWMLVILLTGLFTPAGAVAASEYLVPAGAMVAYWGDTPVWDYWLDDVETSLLLFLDTDAVMLADTGNEKRLQITCASYPEAAFTLNFYRKDKLKGQTLMDQNERQLTALITAACGDGGDLVGVSDVFEVMDQCYFVRGRTVADDVYTDHVLAIYDGWLVHMSATPDGKNELVSEDVLTYQNTVLYSLFYGSNFPHYNSYALPDSAFELKTADGKKHLVLDYDEDDFKTLILLTPEGRTIALQMGFIKDAAFAGQTLETLSFEGRQALYQYIDLSGGDEADVAAIEANMTHVPAGDGFYTLYAPPESDFNVTLALKGEWAMVVYLFNLSDYEPAVASWCSDAMDNINRRFIGEEELSVVDASVGVEAEDADMDELGLAQMYIAGSEFTFVYPQNAQAMQVLEDETVQAVLLLAPELEDVAYALFTILSPDLRDLDLMNLSQEDKETLIGRISSQSGGNIQVCEATRLADDGLADNGPVVLRVREKSSEGGYTEHLLGFCGNWLVNMMVQRMDAEMEMTGDEIAYQEMLMAWNLRYNDVYGGSFP